MKTYCKNCLKKKPVDSTVCSSCNTEMSADLTEEEIRPIVQRLHKKTNVYRERISTGLSFFVIGLTFLIIGALFYRLAFKLDQSNTDEIVFVLTTTCAEFWVAMISLIGGGIATVFGATWAILWSYKRREIYHDVDEIRANHSLTVSSTPLIFSIWMKKISYRVRQTIFVMKRKKAEKADK